MFITRPTRAALLVPSVSPYFETLGWSQQGPLFLLCCFFNSPLITDGVAQKVHRGVDSSAVQSAGAAVTHRSLTGTVLVKLHGVVNRICIKYKIRYDVRE